MANYIAAGDIRSGNVYTEDGKSYSVISYNHIKKARAQAVVRLKVRDLATGSVNEKSYNSDNKLEEADVSKRSAQYLYEDGANAYFMDTDSYEQVALASDAIGDALQLLVEGTKVIVSYLDGRAISIDLPKAVELEVVTAPDVNIGGTVTNPSKDVELETGIKISVPTFVKTGDRVKVNTDTLQYISRV